MLAIVVDIANRVVTARDTLAGAFAENVKQYCLRNGSSPMSIPTTHSSRNVPTILKKNVIKLLAFQMTWRTDWVEIYPEGKPGYHDNHAARNVDADDVEGELPDICDFGDYCHNLLIQVMMKLSPWCYGLDYHCDLSFVFVGDSGEYVVSLAKVKSTCRQLYCPGWGHIC